MPGAQQGQPPFGSSPAVGPTPNLGFQAQGVAKLALIVEQLVSVLPSLGAASEQGKDVLKAIQSLSKHIPADGANKSVQNNELMNLMLKRQQMSAMMPQQAAPASPAPLPAAA